MKIVSLSVKSGLTIPCLALFLSLCTSIDAEEINNKINDNEIDTLIVTASRTPVSLNQTGGSITVIDRQMIERRNAISLDELLRDVPGFAVNRAGPIGALTQVRARGAEANQLLVLIDGIEINDSALSSEFNFAHMPTSNIERIEIVNGPQSAIWGADAMAGVINIITQKANDTKADLLVQSGSFGTNIGRMYTSVAKDRWQLGIGIDYLDSDGTNISRTGNEKDGYTNLTYSIDSGYQPSNSFQLELTLRKSQTENNYDGIDFLTGLPGDSDFVTESDFLYSQFQMSAEQLDGKIRHQFSSALTDTENRNTTYSPVSDDFLSQKRKTSYQISYTPDESNQSWTLVAEHEQTDYQQRGVASFFGNPNQNRSTLTKSLVIEYIVGMEELTLSASVRRDKNEEFKDATPWRITAAYQLTDRTRLHATLGRSTKNPTFVERFGYFTNFLGNPTLETEQSESWELGVKQAFLKDHLSLSVVYFRTKLENEINGFWFSPSLFTFTSINMDGTSKRQGTEIALDWTMSEKVSTSLNYTYTDATEESSGRQIDELRRPRHLASLNLDFTLTDRSHLNISAQHNGKQADRFFPPWPASPQRVSLKKYTLLGLNYSYQLSPAFIFRAGADNLLDEAYEETYGFQASGRSLYAGIQMKW